MADVQINLNVKGMSDLSVKLDGLIDRLGGLDDFWRDVAQYMVRSTQNRILRQKIGQGKAPDGEPWAPLSQETTIPFKGHGHQLFQSGELAGSVYVADIHDKGFTISASADHAEYMQFGVSRTSGWIKGKKVPARPFMGFSETNIRTISKMLKKYLESSHTSDFGDDE
jgi:phage virion morphogenesis protein